MKRVLLLCAIVLSIGVSALAVFYPNFIARAGQDYLDQPTQPQISLPDGMPISLRVNGQGNSPIVLSDGRDIATTYTGPETKRKIEDRSARPLSLAAGDLDEDGVPDLVSSYTSNDANLLVIHRGNVDAIYGDTPEANERKARGEFTDAPFLSPATVFDLPDRPDVIGTGDFNADGHRDIVVAALGSQRLYWLAGNGMGGLGEAQAIGLPGKVTAMTVGEINRQDGLDDVIVGIDGASGAQALVYESADGAFKGEPEALTLPRAASSLALGQLDDGYEMDLAVAAGSDLVIMHGRDRRTSLDQEARLEALPAQIDEQSMPFPITSLTIGDFIADHHSEVALLSADGVLRLVERRPGTERWGTIISEVATGHSTDLSRCSPEMTPISVCAATALIRARASVGGNDDLVVVNQADHQLQIIATEEASRAKDHARRTPASPTMRVAASLEMESDPVAVLPMRLNIDAFSDLVILKTGGEGALAVAMTAPLRTAVVNSSGDEANANCSAPPNICTLRRAIDELGSTTGADLINFSVSSVTINPALGELRQINYPVTIDGGSNRVEVKGSGLTIYAANVVVRGLVINSTATSFRNGIVLDKLSFNPGGNCFIEGNYIGTDAAGANVAVINQSNAGIVIGAVNNNTIGGTTPAARNLISGFNNAGIQMTVSSATGNKIQGNYIGTDSSGTRALGNGYGVIANFQTGNVNTVGGTVAFARNIISGNRSGGVLAGANWIVQGNYIGTDANGVSDVGNLGTAVTANGGNGQIGGTAGGAGNVIAFNKSQGVIVNIGTGTAVRRNSIFGNTSLAISGNGSSRPTLSGTTGTLTGATASTAFTIEFFTNDICGTHPQAKNYLDGRDVTVTTNASGSATFSLPAGQFITATASAPGLNTSTISNCITGAPTPTPTPTPTVSDLELRFNPASPPPATIHLGVDSGTYSVVVTNNGPAKAFAVTVSGNLPANTSLDTGTASFCTTTGSGTTYTCTLGDLDPAPVPHATSGTGVKVFDLVLKPTALGSITLAPSVTLDTSRTTDNVSSNNSATTTTLVKVNVELLGFEVTQTIQDLQNSVPLVADKPTFIRAYVGPDALFPVEGVAVSASLVGTNSNGVTNGTLTPSNPGKRINLLQAPRRAVLQDSFYFELPANWIKAGTLQFRIQSPDLDFTCSEADAVKDCAATVTFRKMNKVSINFIGVTWKDAGNVSHTPAANDLLQTAAEIKARFPMSEFDVEFSSTTITENPCGASLSPILDSIEILRKEDIRNGKTVKKYYMGLMADQNACGAEFGNNGIAFSPGNSSLVFLMRNGIGGTPVMDGNSRAHELAHNTGIQHTTSGQGELDPAADYLPADGRISTGRAEYGADSAYGFDIYDSSSNRDGARIFLPTTYDSMSYERPRWMSVFNYQKLFNSIGVSTGTNAPEIDLNAVTVTQSVVVSGTLSSSPETGTIAPLFVKSSNASITLPVAGSYEMRLEDADGQTLATYSFDPPTDADGGKGSYSLILPWDSNAKRIRLMHNGQELASRQASANPPTVTVTSPNGGETLSGSTSTFTWTASDVDGNPLSYVIDYSPDAGTTWTALAAGVSSTNYTADLTKLAASTQALIRVTASDGFNSTTDSSNAVFTVSPHAPEASISSPENNHLYVGDQTITLNGMGIDIEDGILDSSRLSWSSNLNGTLGTGSSLSINASTLTEGTHTITLTATDSTARPGTAIITIRVFRTAPVQPATLAVGPVSLAFNAPLGTVQSASQILAIRNNGNGALTWSATADQPWLQLSAASGTAPTNLDVTINPAGRAIGQYTGKITITASGAANSPQVVNVNLTIVQSPLATITGRVLTPGGLGLRNAVVSLTDSQGVRRTATTSSFGVYSFENVRAGETYIIGASSKRYRFAARSLLVDGNLSNLDFVGLE